MTHRYSWLKVLGAILALLGLVLCNFVRADDQAPVDEQLPVDEQATPGEQTAPESKSKYGETVPVGGGSKTVGAELVSADAKKQPIFDTNWTHEMFPRFYTSKEKVNSMTGIAYSVDYAILTQKASSSFTDDDAASSVFRVYGNWLVAGRKEGTTGSLVFKYEHRGAVFGRQAPRDLGFATGSALSTANFKQSGWGWTDLYWKQLFNGGKSAILLGHMDPGDWADQHVLLNAWTNLMNDAFYNNPTEAIPKRTFSLVGRLGLSENWYAAAGVHDANGKDNHIDFQQVWDTPELFSWVEVGFRPFGHSSFGETTHLHYWHQDARVQAGTRESWGVTLSSSRVYDNGFTTVFRAGYSKGDALQMRNFLGFAVSVPIRGSDHLLVGTSWGSPPDKTGRSQVTSEIIYRLQLTQNTTISPDLQVTINPSFNDEESVIYVLGLRARLTF